MIRVQQQNNTSDTKSAAELKEIRSGIIFQTIAFLLTAAAREDKAKYLPDNKDPHADVGASPFIVKTLKHFYHDSKYADDKSRVPDNFELSQDEKVNYNKLRASMAKLSQDIDKNEEKITIPFAKYGTLAEPQFWCNIKSGGDNKYTIVGAVNTGELQNYLQKEISNPKSAWIQQDNRGYAEALLQSLNEAKSKNYNFDIYSYGIDGIYVQLNEVYKAQIKTPYATSVLYFKNFDTAVKDQRKLPEYPKDLHCIPQDLPRLPPN